MKTQKVFVYGTLKRGWGNHRLLTGARYLGDARIRGTMHHLGGFPAIHLESDDVVHGELYEVTSETLARLDRLEGIPTFYQRTRVRMSSGSTAWVYVMPPDRLTSREVIASGRWERA
jgi:gamma-glutamylcyclotransferase (GGCT)/AIG2-like uncharacterized protein YtfP